MEQLQDAQQEIRAQYPVEVRADYFALLRRWLCGQISITELDKQARRLIDTDIHTKFLLCLIKFFENEGVNAVEPDWENFSVRTAAGFLPTKRMIAAWAMVAAMENGLFDVDPKIADEVFDHVRTLMANIMESILKMSRGFICDESGFTHAFGHKKLRMDNNAGHIVPATEPIIAEDLLDCLDLEPEIIPHASLRDRLIKRLENVANCHPNISDSAKSV
ncbi:transcriptional adapter 1-like [Ditylenchus destructor]|nr:transcriptional adapter 1-like [Ditylenchus destructor]